MPFADLVRYDACKRADLVLVLLSAAPGIDRLNLLMKLFLPEFQLCLLHVPLQRLLYAARSP